MQHSIRHSFGIHSLDRLCVANEKCMRQHTHFNKTTNQLKNKLLVYVAGFVHNNNKQIFIHSWLEWDSGFSWLFHSNIRTDDLFLKPIDWYNWPIDLEWQWAYTFCVFDTSKLSNNRSTYGVWSNHVIYAHRSQNKTRLLHPFKWVGCNHTNTALAAAAADSASTGLFNTQFITVSIYLIQELKFDGIFPNLHGLCNHDWTKKSRKCEKCTKSTVLYCTWFVCVCVFFCHSWQFYCILTVKLRVWIFN